MTDGHESRIVEGTTDESRPEKNGIQPRVVFVLLLAGSFAGVWLSHLGNRPLLRGSWWVVVVSLGTLVGGLYWRIALFEPSTFEQDCTRQWVESRWRTLEGIVIGTLVLGGIVLLETGGLEPAADVGTIALSTGIVLSPIVWLLVRRSDLGGLNQTKRLRAILMTLLVVSLGGFAWLETRTTAVDWLVRFGHLSAFALWIGGALWHNVIVLPAMRSGRATKTLQGQARRFRRHLVVVIPLLLLTGSYQAVQLLGFSPALLLDSPVGALVGFKLLVLVVLSGLVVVRLRKASPSG